MKDFEEFFEKKKLPKGLQDYLDKKNGKKDEDKDDKKDKKEDPTKKWLGKVKDDAKKDEKSKDDKKDDDKKNEMNNFEDFFVSGQLNEYTEFGLADDIRNINYRLNGIENRLEKLED